MGSNPLPVLGGILAYFALNSMSAQPAPATPSTTTTTTTAMA